MDGLNGEIITYKINDTPNDTTRLNTLKIIEIVKESSDY